MLWTQLVHAMALFAAGMAGRTVNTAATSTPSANAQTTRYLVLDTTLDTPSWTAVLMAMDASASPDSPIQLLGVLATESSELGAFENLMESTGMMDCLELVSCEEEELYPLNGAYTLQNAPEPVKKLVQWVDEHPGQVTLYSSAALTTVAYAHAVDSTFASKVGELVIVARLDNSDDFNESGQVGFYDVSPFLKDQEAFIAILGGDIPLIRIMGPLEPILSGPEIAARVRAAGVGGIQDVDAQRAKLATRPFAAAYLAGHMSRMFAGHDKAILMQEPAMAAILYPDLIKAEPDVEFQFEEHDEDTDSEAGASAPALKLHKLADEDITPDDRATLIAQIDEEEFWGKLVHVRSRDWAGFCKQQAGVQQRAGGSAMAHDEL